MKDACNMWYHKIHNHLKEDYWKFKAKEGEI